MRIKRSETARRAVLNQILDKMKNPFLYLGCTKFRHEQIGIHAIVNARAGNQYLNSRTDEDIEMIRDARKIQDKLNNRIRFYQFNSKHFRKAKQVQHLIDQYED
jgi:hypothetical protein